MIYILQADANMAVVGLKMMLETHVHKHGTTSLVWIYKTVFR